MKNYRIILITIILLIIPLSLWFFSSTGPLVSKRSEAILSSNSSILTDINATYGCTYFRPTKLLETRNPSFSCFSNNWFQIDSEAPKEILRIQDILSSRGWKTSDYTGINKTFYKDDFSIYVQIYNPDYSRTNEQIKDGKFRLLVIFSHIIY